MVYKTPGIYKITPVPNLSMEPEKSTLDMVWLSRSVSKSTVIVIRVKRLTQRSQVEHNNVGKQDMGE